METARKGIFDPSVLTVQMALAIYVSVYFVDTVLLYGFSGFGMPVSTTACLVFELVGAALFLAGYDNVEWHQGWQGGLRNRDVDCHQWCGGIFGHACISRGNTRQGQGS